MIAWLASYPRSGNTFARVVLQRMYGIPSPAIYPSTRRAMFPEINGQISPAEARTKAELVVFKTHELPTDDSPAIYLVRDGRDALVSHAHYVLKYDMQLDAVSHQQFHDVLRYLIESTDSFGGWAGNVFAWTSRSAPTTIMHFEDLIASPQSSMRAAVESLRLSLQEVPSGDIPGFSEMRERDPNFFRKGSVGGWRDDLSDDLHELFWQRHGAAMNAVGYQRDDSPSAHRSVTSAA